MHDFNSGGMDTLVPHSTDTLCFESDAIDQPSLLPGAIANAIVRAYEASETSALSTNAKRVFACLIRYGVRLKDLKAKIYIRKSTIPMLLSVNEAQVYRALHAIEEVGLIARDDQAGINTI